MLASLPPYVLNGGGNDSFLRGKDMGEAEGFLVQFLLFTDLEQVSGNQFVIFQTDKDRFLTFGKRFYGPGSEKKGKAPAAG